ncbi:MAG: phosphoglycolate phosphatase [Pseudohongiella sp.]|nr:MAG: phosphoglycolate phosphatase [Pseudohongiella sp.]
MPYAYLVFDLDGTLSDPQVGIVRSLNYALSAHGFEQQDEQRLATYIGPPLDTIFEALTQSSESTLIASLVSKYRERYSDVGFAENVLYRDIPQVLESLSAAPGLTLGVCTSKRVDFAERIVELHGLSKYFEFIDGADVGTKKWQQLEDLLATGTISSDSLMIGDRHVDLTAAHRNGLDSAGVLWGFGPRAELEEHEPAFLFSRPEELLSLIGQS